MCVWLCAAACMCQSDSHPVSLNVRMYEWMHVGLCGWINVDVYEHDCVSVALYVCMCVCTCMHIRICLCMCVCMYVCVVACACVYVSVYACTIDCMPVCFYVRVHV